MAYTSSILAVVGADEKDDFSPKKLTIWITDSNSVLCERTFLFKIEAVKLNKSRLIACLKDKIHIYNMANIKFLHSVDVKFSLARLALSPCSDSPYLIYSDNIETGLVTIYDVHALAVKNTFEAHKAPVLKMNINYYGTHAATCSTKGTVIRVFSIPKGDRICTFRRGMNTAQVFSINFNINTTYLTLSSNSGTIHLFKIPIGQIEQPAVGSIEGEKLAKQIEESKKSEEKSTGWFGGMMKAILMTNDNYEAVVESIKSFMTLKHSDFSKHNICALSQDDDSVVVVNNDGKYFWYKVDLTAATEKLEKEGSIFDPVP